MSNNVSVLTKIVVGTSQWSRNRGARYLVPVPMAQYTSSICELASHDPYQKQSIYKVFLLGMQLP